MEEELISKKELLELAGISYGQLYRWKRKQLIPEDWFIRKSTFTGQETFFPKKMMLARIHNIVNMKDDLSLDELADKLSGPPPDIRAEFTVNILLERNIVSNIVLDRFGKTEGDRETYGLDEVLSLFTVDSLLSKGEMNLEEADLLVRTLLKHTSQLAGKEWELYFIRKMGVTSFILTTVQTDLVLDEGVRLVSRVRAADLLEQLRGKLF